MKDPNSNNNWINVAKDKWNPFIEPYYRINNLRFILKNKNITFNYTINNNNKEILLFIKGVSCDQTGVFFYMILLTWDLNELNYDNFANNSLNKDIEKDNVLYITNNENEFIKESITFFR